MPLRHIKNLEDFFVDEHLEADEVAELLRLRLVGRRVVEASPGELVLDNGVKIIIEENSGCGGCSNGWSFISWYDVVDSENAIVDVQVTDIEGDGYGGDPTYTISIFYEDKRISEVEANDGYGNGYYGGGFYVTVKGIEED